MLHTGFTTIFSQQWYSSSSMQCNVTPVRARAFDSNLCVSARARPVEISIFFMARKKKSIYFFMELRKKSYFLSYFHTSKTQIPQSQNTPKRIYQWIIILIRIPLLPKCRNKGDSYNTGQKPSKMSAPAAGVCNRCRCSLPLFTSIHDIFENGIRYIYPCYKI